MTTAKVKEQIDAMSDDDRYFAMAYLRHLANERDDQRKTPLEARMKRMDEGRKTSQRSYLARLNYVHQNAKHHGVALATDWK